MDRIVYFLLGLVGTVLGLALVVKAFHASQWGDRLALFGWGILVLIPGLYGILFGLEPFMRSDSGGFGVAMTVYMSLIGLAILGLPIALVLLVVGAVLRSTRD